MRRLSILLFAWTLTACGGDDGPCEEEAVRCADDEDVLEQCVDGQWVAEEDCAMSGMMCHEEMGHCMAEG